MFVCTENDNGKLVWMHEEDSKKVIAARTEAAEKKAAEEAAAAEQQRLADEQAAAAEAQRIADEQAAAEAAEAQRIADEQARQQYVAPAPAPANVSYQNCDAVKAAGAAPIRAGQPGYAKHLDRDGDGVGCEK